MASDRWTNGSKSLHNGAQELPCMPETEKPCTDCGPNHQVINGTTGEQVVLYKVQTSWSDREMRFGCGSFLCLRMFDTPHYIV